ncbi:hypothetical protein BGW38_010851 [Lunasporangiospora selenospora]|uniref:Uncharacterized protein n=1 Tax=Lunasporangiospora selenospora TaxID=979761 RepID=A0A9P6G219_9FUNG|nr:hypothetical protein BGW38_010851 [Lunasporangiospora selenospora]
MSALFRSSPLLRAFSSAKIACQPHHVQRFATPSPILLLRTSDAQGRTFSTTSPALYSLAKKKLSKKITIPKDPYLLSEKVVKFCKNGKLDDAITLVLETPASRQSEVVWNHLIQESSKTGKPQLSWKLLADMKKRGFEPSERTYTILLNALAINPASPFSVSRAQGLISAMEMSEDLPPTVVHTNALLKVCSRKPDYETLLETYNSMPKSGSTAPDVITYNIVINAFARMGGDEGFEKAWAAWEDCIAAKTRRPDEIDLDYKVVDAILLACREARKPSHIKRGYRLVESLYGLTISEFDTPEPEIAPKNMSKTDRALAPSKSLGLGAFLAKETIQPRTVELLLSICVKIKEYKRALKYLDLIRTKFPEFAPDSQLLSSTMHLYITQKEYGKAIDAWDQINENNLQHTPATFKQGLDATLKLKDWDKTLEIYQALRSLIEANGKLNTAKHRPVNLLVTRQDAWTLASTLRCALKTRHVDEGLEILKEVNWRKVVLNKQYPRANADVAEYVSRLYTAKIKASKTTPPPGSASTESAPVDNERIEELEVELERVNKIHKTLLSRLSEYDAEKAKKEKEGKESYKNRVRASESEGNFSSKEGISKEQDVWKPRGEDEVNSGWRKVSLPDTERVSRSKADSFKRYSSPDTERASRSRADSFKSRSSQTEPRRERRQGEQRRQGHDVEDAFQTTRQFSREFSE